jgi:hypothetical protein
MFSADYTPVWEEGASATESGDFEDSVTFTTTDADPDEVAGSNSETNGPLTATVEQSGWTTDDVMMALSALNVLMFAALLYLSVQEGT